MAVDVVVRVGGCGCGGCGCVRRRRWTVCSSGSIRAGPVITGTNGLLPALLEEWPWNAGWPLSCPIIWDCGRGTTSPHRGHQPGHDGPGHPHPPITQHAPGSALHLPPHLPPHNAEGADRAPGSALHLPPPLAPPPSPILPLRPWNGLESLECQGNGDAAPESGGICATRREEKCVIAFPTLLHRAFSLKIQVFLK